MRIIATRTCPSWGLVEEEEFVSIDEQIKSVFLEFGWAKPYDPTLPFPPKGMNDYEPGLSYPINRYVIYTDGHLYKSNAQTSTTWVPSEWTLKI